MLPTLRVAFIHMQGLTYSKGSCSQLADMLDHHISSGHSSYLMVCLVFEVDTGVHQFNQQRRWFCVQRHRSSLANSGEAKKKLKL